MNKTSYFNCESCGCISKRAHGNQRFCAKCKEKRKDELRRQRHKENLELDVPMIRCASCGGRITGAHGKVYCEACARQRKLQLGYARNKKPEAEEKRYIRPRRTGRLFDCSGKDLEEVATEAKALGMTYGEYTSACYGNTIERRLAMMGISREKASRLIISAKRRKAASKKKKNSNTAPSRGGRLRYIQENTCIYLSRKRFKIYPLSDLPPDPNTQNTHWRMLPEEFLHPLHLLHLYLPSILRQHVDRTF